MNLRQVEAFRAVMMAGTFTGAGAVLHVSQPAVTRLIADLERDCGLRLFDRRGGRVSPTPEAEALYEEVERSFVGLGRIEETARELRDFRSARLTVAAMPALCLDLMPEAVGRFLQRFPHVQVTAQARSTQRIVSWIRNQRVDLGLVGPPFDEGGIERILTVRAPCLCVLPTGHRFADRDGVEASDLDGQELIGFTEDQKLGQRIGKMFADAGVRPSVRVETPLSFVACRLVQAGAGLAIVEPFTARNYEGRGLVFRPLQPELLFEFAVIAPMHRQRSRSTEAFLEIVVDTLERFALPAGAKISLT